jgi:hypothetical protein
MGEFDGMPGGNPYQSPENEAAPVNQPAAGAVLTENALLHLKDAAPWLRFLAIIGFIACGLTVLVGIVMVIALAITGNGFASAEFQEIAEAEGVLKGSTWFEKITNGLGAFMGIIYIGIAVLYFFPSKFLWTFGEKLRAYLQTNSSADLELALKNNKSFWKYMGIATIVCLALIPVLFIIVIIVTIGAMI